MKNLLTMFFCIISFAAFSQSFNTTFPHPGFGDQVELEETGYRVMGFGNNITGNHLLVIHVDKYGDTIQTRKICFDFDFFSPSFTLRSASDSDGNHYLNMSLNSDSISLVKLSPDWQEVWRKNLTNKQGEITTLKVTEDNHIIAAADRRLFKLDADGNIIWQRSFGEAFDILSRPYSVIETENNELFVYSLDYWMDPDQLYFETPMRSKLRIFNQNGVMRDSILFPGYYQKCLLYDDHFIGVAPIRNSHQYYPSVLFRHDFNGLITDSKEINVNEDVFFYHMVENNDGNLVVFGDTENSFVMHCMTKEGDSLWTRFIDNEAEAVAMDMKLAADGGYVISTFTELNDGLPYPGLIKTDAMGNISGVGFEESDISQKVRVYPNPAAEYVVFELEKPIQNASITLTDITGRQIKTVTITGAKTVCETTGVPSGVYLYRIDGANTVASGKLVILK